MKVVSILLSIFVLLLSACAAPDVSQPPEAALPTTEALSTPTHPPDEPTSVVLSNSATYTDDFAGFSLDYPASWFVESSALASAEESFAYAVSIASWDIKNPPTPSGKDLNTMPEGETKIDVAVVKQAMTLEEAVKQQYENESGSPVLARKDVTLANGLPGVILDVEGMAGPTRTLITILNGNIIYVSAFGNLENFEPIALTLRPK